MPLADGGEGTLDALGGANRTSVVEGPLGEAVTASWRLSDGLAVIEMAQASGLALAGGADGNDPERATTRGTGQLIAEAISAGARRIVVGVGGSATSDGGWGAVEAIGFVPKSTLIEVACDVSTRFIDAARIYGPQKGADPAAVDRLEERLVQLAERYRETYGRDVATLAGSGAAGGLAGGLAALGAKLRSGFDLVADHLGLNDHLGRADIVVTGEGRVDATSWEGKVVGGVVERARRTGTPVWVAAGAADLGAAPAPDVTIRTLVDRCGEEDALTRTEACLADVVAELISLRL